ncbi:homeobox protein SEBOX-like, partial [Carlito syrichta]|uniref:Homeobox protein SEBOX-like n=1 Tax=Carlito syrichta TaxID=1868482 RepID=A0A3Q0EC78_CARSF
TWFKNYKTKQRQLESRCSLGKDQTQGHDQLQYWTQEYLCKTVGQYQLFITKTQRSKLVQVFKMNPFPDIVTRKKLAKQTGIRESRIQMWFQNQRNLHPEQSRRDPVDSMVDGPNEGLDMSVKEHQIDLFSPPDRSDHFSSSNSFSRNQTSPSHMSFVPWDPSMVCVSQGPSATQAVQEGENSNHPLILRNHLPILPTLGENFSDTQTQPEHKEQPPQDLGQMNIAYILQWWDEICQALIAEWSPLKGIH